MRRRYPMAAALLVAAVLCAPGAARAQPEPWGQRMHQLRIMCDEGNRAACIRFGYYLGVNQGRRAEWRREHPNWWWWERY